MHACMRAAGSTATFVITICHLENSFTYLAVHCIVLLIYLFAYYLHVLGYCA